MMAYTAQRPIITPPPSAASLLAIALNHERLHDTTSREMLCFNLGRFSRRGCCERVHLRGRVRLGHDAGQMLSSPSMIPHFWVYVTTVVCGLAVLAWPEQDGRMFLALSKRHGPSTLDLIGLAFILVGYVPMAARVWARRMQLQSRFGASWLWMIALVWASWGGIVTGLVAERELVLWTSVTASTFVQALLVVPAFLRPRTSE